MGTLIKTNEAMLASQSKSIGLKLNSDKTEYITFNSKVSDSKSLNLTRTSRLLGLPFNTTTKGFDLAPACDMICKRLRDILRRVHILRSLLKDTGSLVRATRILIYQSIGELHIIDAYSISKDLFKRLRYM